MNPDKPLITLDFDGVIHQYTTPWTTAEIIPDPPVEGAIDWLLQARCQYSIAILSARSAQPGGIVAMQRWLKRYLIRWLQAAGTVKQIQARHVLAGFDPQTSDSQQDLLEWADGIVNSITWPTTKLPSLLYIDDNGYRFEGRFPPVDKLHELESWVKD